MLNSQVMTSAPLLVHVSYAVIPSHTHLYMCMIDNSVVPHDEHSGYDVQLYVHVSEVPPVSSSRKEVMIYTSSLVCKLNFCLCTSLQLTGGAIFPPLGPKLLADTSIL